MADKFTNEVNNGFDSSAEEINSKARDRVDDLQNEGQTVADKTPKSADAIFEDPQYATTATKARERAAEKKENLKDIKAGKVPDKFEVDLDRYVKFVDQVTSNASKNMDDLIIRYRELKKEGCNIERLDTAASGMSAEGGEFMEIVKKLKFQGKPWDDKTKEHLTKELGDIMWYVAQACLALDMRLDEVIYINTLKLAARYPDGMFDVNYSENRAPGDI